METRVLIMVQMKRLTLWSIPSNDKTRPDSTNRLIYLQDQCSPKIYGSHIILHIKTSTEADASLAETHLVI